MTLSTSSATGPKITLVAAVARNGTIGADGGLPWRLPADLKRFKALTMGHTMIMGRKTFESIGRALPGRRTIVVTRDRAWDAPETTVAHSVDEAVELAGAMDPGAADQAVMVVGGGEIYRQTLERADRLEITLVDADVVGDTRFPDIDPTVWHEVEREDADGYSFVSYRRRQPVRDLQVLLASMQPQLHDGEYVFCTVPRLAGIPDGCHPVATVTEAEGMTLVLPLEEAERAGLAGDFVCSWITLGVNSALAAVGLTAAFATTLTQNDISCNVIAGFHHDHLFVPTGSTQAAMSALAVLAHSPIQATGSGAPDLETPDSATQLTGAPGRVEP